jgi:hypothetical protein
MKVSFEVTVTVDGEYSKVSSKSPLLNIAAQVANPEQYKKDVALAAHLLMCSSLGIAGQVGVSVEDMLALDPNKLTPKD